MSVSKKSSWPRCALEISRASAAVEASNTRYLCYGLTQWNFIVRDKNGHPCACASNRFARSGGSGLRRKRVNNGELNFKPRAPIGGAINVNLTATLFHDAVNCS